MQLVCPECLIKNRVPDDRLDDHPVCGKCKHELMQAEPVNLTDESFARYVEGTELPVVVDFWAEWCGPCKMIGPLIEELATEYDGKALIGKLNVDENPDIAATYGIRSIPTLLVFKGGEIVDRIVGAVPKSNIAQKIDNQL